MMRPIERRRIKADFREFLEEIELPQYVEMPEQRPGEKQTYPRKSVPRPWQTAAQMLTNAVASRAGQPRSDFIISRIEHQIWLVEHGEQPDRIVVLDYQLVTDFLDKQVDPELRARLETVT